jgi:hypothetical protein
MNKIKQKSFVEERLQQFKIEIAAGKGVMRK